MNRNFKVTKQIQVFEMSQRRRRMNTKRNIKRRRISWHEATPRRQRRQHLPLPCPSSSPWLPPSSSFHLLPQGVVLQLCQDAWDACPNMEVNVVDVVSNPATGTSPSSPSCPSSTFSSSYTGCQMCCTPSESPLIANFTTFYKTRFKYPINRTLKWNKSPFDC